MQLNLRMRLLLSSVVVITAATGCDQEYRPMNNAGAKWEISGNVVRDDNGMPLGGSRVTLLRLQRSCAACAMESVSLINTYVNSDGRFILGSQYPAHMS